MTGREWQELKAKQRLYNYYMSVMIETIALAPKAPILVTVPRVRFFPQRCAWARHCIALGLGMPPFGVAL